MRDVVYEDVCIRDTKNPILMDTHYPFRGSDRDKIPVFQEIVLRSAQILGRGKITLDGFDSWHRLGLVFDGVSFDGSVDVTASHADLTMGPGPVNFVPSGEDVKVVGKPGQGRPNFCADKFIPFPEK